jgi:hypothetical protein
VKHLQQLSPKPRPRNPVSRSEFQVQMTRCIWPQSINGCGRTARRHDGRGRGAIIFAVTATVARGTGVCRRLMKNIEAHVDENVRSSTRHALKPLGVIIVGLVIADFRDSVISPDA